VASVYSQLATWRGQVPQRGGEPPRSSAWRAGARRHEPSMVMGERTMLVFGTAIEVRCSSVTSLGVTSG
jgi:hypothetical protein